MPGRARRGPRRRTLGSLRARRPGREPLRAREEVAGRGVDVAVREDGRDPGHGTGPAEGELQQPERRGDLARRELARPPGSGRGPGDPAGGGPGRVRPDEPAPGGLGPGDLPAGGQSRLGLAVSAGSRSTTGPSTSSILRISSGSSRTPEARTFSRTCSGRVAPTIAADTFGFCRTHAIASCA